MLRSLLATLLCLPLLCSAQQIYKTTDENGNVVFTDQPPPESDAVQRVELQRTNTSRPPTIRPLPPAAQESDAEELVTAPLEYRLSIDRPDNETTIPMGPGNFTVSARVEPPPGPDHLLQLRLNGENRGEAQRSSIWELTNVFRGAHDITVSVVDKDGEDLATSQPVRVYVLRPSSNFRN